MREIKFRAWDKQEKKMVYDVERTYDGYPVNGVSSFGAILDCPNFFDVMQFTGLKDKNGKEIYEGDILLLPSGKSGKVFWEKFMAGFAVSLSRFFPELIDADTANDSEIVGNIYENKELKKRLTLNKKH